VPEKQAGVTGDDGGGYQGLGQHEQPVGVEHSGEVVIDEAFGIARLPGGVPQVLLQRRQRTVEADRHDDQRVDDG